MPTLRIVSVNDVYTLENFPRLSTMLRHYRTTAPADRMLVTVPGDFLSPSLLSSLDAGRGMVDCLNALGVTHVTFGNHEDDIAIDELRARVRELRATWLASNVRGFDPPLPSSDVVEIGHLRIGLLGVVMNDSSVYHRPPFGAPVVDDPNDAAMRETARLLASGCASVVPLTHQPMDADRALARAQRDPAFPVIVGGHEHDVHMEQVDGTWIVKAGSDAVHAVIVDIAWDDGAPPRVTARLDDVARYPEDFAMRARVDVHMRRVHDLESATLLRLLPGEVLSSVGTRHRQTSMGTLLCSKVRDAFGADACLFNGGGIRGARDYTERFTFGDLQTEVPFDNEVVVVKMPGRAMREAIAASRAHAPAESGGFLQVDDRTSLETIDDARVYCVAVVRDLFFGLDKIEPLMRFAREHPEAVPPATAGREIKIVLVEAFAKALWAQIGGFEAVDLDHDGAVTEAEIAAAVARATGDAPSAITAGLLLRALDRNHDDAVTRDEADDTDAKREP